MTVAQSSAPARAGVVHIKHRHTTHFTVVGNHLAQHADLSLVAIGIGVYVQSLPDGATIGIKDLTRRFPEGEITIARALRELEKAGYLERRRVRNDKGQVATVTRWYEQPTSAAPLAPVKPTEPQPEPEAPADPPAAELLAALRRRDPRLLLSRKDIAALAPAVRDWLDRGISPAQITRTLTADLPVGPIRRPARLLAHRLREWIPPHLPAIEEKQVPPRPHPLQTCDGCDRAFRAPAPGLCRDCRTAAA
ncbi:helix-turn-helix domain-containing protein [Streptomyces sp. AV19]|uniref:helix-turn-helix domain-containing protein n=1 Tax=Streptomyces sp. AV19 TaxID=2793068 RepID=UPI0018FED8D7|nr:helix-turn-helix domain-containing protein [Streptomyces sp. AV19]MBH1935859.1 helix-turn-helix domain-containing protein [Streptomyces sp. AV19]MDG4534357.1 helix-turn-helix domain-containing protein [Streptomyces sp. AV19]